MPWCPAATFLTGGECYSLSGFLSSQTRGGQIYRERQYISNLALKTQFTKMYEFQIRGKQTTYLQHGMTQADCP